MNYIKPFPKGIKYKIAKPKGIYVHENYPESKYAIDFLLDINTPILASRDGMVVKLKSDSNKWGVDSKFTKEVNFVAIDHGGNTYSEYLHLGKDKVIVKKGQKVKVGKLLGYTGFSGVMDSPHLHFNVFKIENGKGISIPFKLKNAWNKRS